MKRWLLLGLVVLALAASGAPKPLTLHVYPHVIQAGGTLRITCRVQPDASNRVLVAGIEDYLEDERQLDGDQAPVTWQAPDFAHVPCATGPAYCAVVRVGGSLRRVSERFEIVGCDPH